MSDLAKDGKEQHSGMAKGGFPEGTPQYPPRVEKILRSQPLSPLSTGELKVVKVRNEVSVQND